MVGKDGTKKVLESQPAFLRVCSATRSCVSVMISAAAPSAVIGGEAVEGSRASIFLPCKAISLIKILRHDERSGCRTDPNLREASGEAPKIVGSS